jgi:hypothetical protein
MAMKPSMTIYTISADPVIAYAAGELSKYLEKMTGVAPALETAGAYREDAGGIWLGLGKDLPAGLPPVASDLDDAVAASVRAGQGWIAGANPRSVLLAVYRWLGKLGCRWVRPGPEGEIIPSRQPEDLTAAFQEQPGYRHRGICIEGAVSLENVLEVIEWSPKVGLSAYFHQFREGHTFFDRWYSHRGNPYRQPEPSTVEQARDYTRKIEQELARRGMIYHAVGHGWTCEAYGIPGLGWDTMQEDWSDEVVSALALVDGKRAMWRDIPLITSLCFSQPGVRQKVIGCVLDYLEQHGNIHALHFWLDDGFNNKCECPGCQEMLPSDFYILLLNELDEAMTARGLNEKVVFLCYADMLWPPESKRLANPDRFIFMFAPITRSYRRPLFPQDAAFPIPPFERNKLVFSSNNDEQLAFLRGWQKTFSGDSFIFEYHLIQGGAYTLYPEPTFMARLLWEDLRNLRVLGLDGYISCQYLRSFYPTGLSMYVLGQALWDPSLTFDQLLEDYFSAAFGADWSLARDYLQSLANLQDVVPVKGVELPLDPQAQEKLQAGIAAASAFEPVVSRNLNLPDGNQARSWFYLDFHRQMMQPYLKMLSAYAAGDEETACAVWYEVKKMVCEAEDELQRVLDVYGFVAAHEAALGIE